MGQDGILRATQRVPRSTGTGRVTNLPDPEGTPVNRGCIAARPQTVLAILRGRGQGREAD